VKPINTHFSDLKRERRSSKRTARVLGEPMSSSKKEDQGEKEREEEDFPMVFIEEE
jgi:hypothetical protein